MADFAGAGVSPAALDAVGGLDVNSLPAVADPGRSGPCLASAPNFFCIGLNYARHAAETGAEPPKERIIASKASSALSDPFDPVVIPHASVKSDWEVECPSSGILGQMAA
ncbi:fumarylacetoacetate hydrolase family protein [Rhodovulum imhoffii]|uniref:fumarylacetoacetate hydrolase family protein n=1 Tax=Rhodovulum imhoffii TaxID=365340 RepID=UPI0030B87A12